MLSSSTRGPFGPLTKITKNICKLGANKVRFLGFLKVIFKFYRYPALCLNTLLLLRYSDSKLITKQTLSTLLPSSPDFCFRLTRKLSLVSGSALMKSAELAEKIVS